MKSKVYTVHAYRYGNREAHSYGVGVFNKKHGALKAAEVEEEHRGGGKYICEVIEWELNKSITTLCVNDICRVIKALPKHSIILVFNSSSA